MKYIITLMLLIPLSLSATLTANYHMDACTWDGTADEVADSSGSTNHAKVDIAGTTTTTSEGQINRSGRLNEEGVTNSAIALPPSLVNGKKIFTFTTWVNLSGSITDKNTFLSAEEKDNSDTDEILFRVDNGTIKLKYKGSSKDFTDLDSTAIFGQWNFLALTINNKVLGTEACITINGGATSAERQCQTFLNIFSKLKIKHLVLGQDRAGDQTNKYYPGGDLNGMMDEVKFYDTAESLANLQSLYSQELQKKYLDGTTPAPIDCSPVATLLVDYRMDECYFLGGANGVSGDVIDSTSNAYNATSVNRIDSNATDAKICRSGAFANNSYAVVDSPQFTLGTDWSMTVWLKFPFVQTGKRYYILGSYPGRGDLPVFQYISGTLKWGIYDNAGGYTTATIDNSLTGWHQLVFVNSSANTTLYVDGVQTNSIARSTSGDVAYLWTSSDDLGGQSIASSLDEMRFFNAVLTVEEIERIYLYENGGYDFDGTIRDCPSCESAPITAHSWELIGIPADLINDSKTVQDVFSDDMQGVFNTDWRIYKRTYNSNDNNGAYQQLALTDLLEFGVGYWLGSSLDERWDVDGTTPVDYDYAGSGCQGSACVEIDLEPVSKNFGAPDNDPNDGSGPYRYFYSGFIGLEKPVDWADCRFIIDGAVLTPSQAEADGFVAKQIWLYNPTVTGADANGYTTCDDTTPGACKLLPFKGFVVELHGITKGKTVKLLIPKE